ncbi:hypothetical protein E4653_05225 [Corynebacterium diphtheriae subsp. lausannense]|nr:hypothetical protein E4653_05225 [Corynebacterium diphtheriae subsp. lausannense]
MIVTVIEAEPINECPKCGQPKVIRDHVIRSLVNLPTISYPTRLYVRLPHYRCTNKHYLQKDLPHWPYLRAQQSKNH